MLTGELRSKIDGVWNAFWAGGIANPLEVIEQITYLLFMRGLDEAHKREPGLAEQQLIKTPRGLAGSRSCRAFLGHPSANRFQSSSLC